MLQQIAWLAAQVPLLRPMIIACFERRPYGAGGAGWNFQHPYDRAHGVRTSGAIPGFLLKAGDRLAQPTTIYAPAQPSIIRTALRQIPETQHCHFIDIGCGKGRPLLIATEFGFPTITGVELSPTVARIARRNAVNYSRIHPQATRINIIVEDALTYKLPVGNLAIFLYHPFNVRAQMAQLLDNIEASLDATNRSIYIVYYNPVWADVFDSSSNFQRRYTAHLPCDTREIGFGPVDSDTVVIWQNRGNSDVGACSALGGRTV
jgi:SAM-dependent methyltransferase